MFDSDILVRELSLSKSWIAFKAEKELKIIKNYIQIVLFYWKKRDDLISNNSYIWMTSPASRRLLKDLQKIQKEEDGGINATP